MYFSTTNIPLQKVLPSTLLKVYTKQSTEESVKKAGIYVQILEKLQIEFLCQMQYSPEDQVPEDKLCTKVGLKLSSENRHGTNNPKDYASPPI